jgi:osmotically-inducible protein OsmY
MKLNKEAFAMPDNRSPRLNITYSLQHSPYSELRQVVCEYRDGLATLRGSVPSYYLKQVAQKLAASTQGVRQVDNRIEVRRRQQVSADRN